MSTDDGKRVAQEWADAMQRLREERDELAACLRDVIGWVPGDTAWHTSAPRDAVERGRIALGRLQR